MDGWEKLSFINPFQVAICEMLAPHFFCECHIAGDQISDARSGCDSHLERWGDPLGPRAWRTIAMRNHKWYPVVISPQGRAYLKRFAMSIIGLRAETAYAQ